MRSRTNLFALVGAGALLALALAGCSQSSRADKPTTNVDFTIAAQSSTPTAVQVPRGGVIVLTLSRGGNLQSKYWSASITDPSILTFSPADGSGRAATMPMLPADKKGETTAVITYTGGSSSQRAALDVTVVAP